LTPRKEVNTKTEVVESVGHCVGLKAEQPVMVDASVNGVRTKNLRRRLAEASLPEVHGPAPGYSVHHHRSEALASLKPQEKER
jgi:hypothetical protein